ncbi:MAG: glycosyltransferase family 39 protein [Desulfobacteraceae bacterium]
MIKNTVTSTHLKVCLLILVGALLCGVVTLSAVPPISRDALTQHLAVPKLYIKHGGIYEIPSMPASYNPMNLDLLYLVPLYLGNDIVPKFIHFSFALLTAWLIFGYLRRRSNDLYALLGVLLFLSLPIIVKLSITVYVDLGLIFFSTSSVLLLLKWVESRFRPRYLVISAVFCGLGMGTKYNGLITFFLLALFIPFIYARYGQSETSSPFHTLGQGLLFILIALLIFSPWMIRNYIWTHNPIYPLYDHWFNPQEGGVHSALSPLNFRSEVYGESWWQMALLPIRVFFQGQDGSPQYFDGRLNPLLFVFPFFAFYRMRDESSTLKLEKKILLAFALLYFAFAFLSVDLRIRYFSAIIPALVILSVYGIRKMIDVASESHPRGPSYVGMALIAVCICLALLLNSVYIFGQYRYVTPFKYLTGEVNRENYIEDYRPEYPAMSYINHNLPLDSLILFVFLGNRGYYCDRDYVFDMIHNKSTLGQFIKSSTDPDTIFLNLRQMGITHLLIHLEIFDRWVKESFSAEDQALLSRFFKEYSSPLYSKWGYGLFQVGHPSQGSNHLYPIPPLFASESITKNLGPGIILKLGGKPRQILRKKQQMKGTYSDRST